MKKILIIDDDRFMADVYRDKFQTAGFDVEVAETGDQGMETLVKRPPDVVLLDLMLPDVNGVEVLKFIRSHPAMLTLPVIVLSSSHAGRMVQAAWKAGANECLTKAACRPNLLVEAVRRVLAKTDAASQVPRPVLPKSDAGNQAIPVTGEASPRQDLPSTIPRLLKDLRQLLQNLIGSDETDRGPRLLELSHGISALVRGAGAAEFPPITRLGGELQGLVNELHDRPKKINASSLRTVAQAVDLLGVLLEQGGNSRAQLPLSPLILVLDGEPLSLEGVCVALEKAHGRALRLDDPTMALKLLAENRFELVILDVDLPGLDGFEFCKKLRATPANAKTSVVLITTLTDFETRAPSILSDGTDFIAKPILEVELAVKALIHLLSLKLPRSSSRL